MVNLVETLLEKAFLNAGLTDEKNKICYASDVFVWLLFSFFFGLSFISNNISFQFFREKKKKPMLEALEKIKSGKHMDT